MKDARRSPRGLLAANGGLIALWFVLPTTRRWLGELVEGSIAARGPIEEKIVRYEQSAQAAKGRQ